jgi:NADH:ubiquinone oxidoreductase subunit F (NADH-binding)
MTAVSRPSPAANASAPRVQIPQRPSAADAGEPGRLLAHAATDLAQHETRLGALNHPEDLIELVRASGLTGRGGAGFPTWRKLAAVAAAGSGQGARRPVVIANGAETEPASEKDAALLQHAPHLVLDGLALVAEAVDAASVHIYVSGAAVAPVQAALAQRGRRDRRPVALVAAPPGFVAGEESAVVGAVLPGPGGRRSRGGAALPRDKRALVVAGGVGGTPALVQNVETLAHLALVARLGPEWFRQVGTPDEPGTVLTTVSGCVATPGVYEVALGTSLERLITVAGGATAPPQAILVGGYHGGWVPPAAELSLAGLRQYGAAPGAGVVFALPVTRCGLVETATILTYLAKQSAGQCGPCQIGLPRLADVFGRLARAGGNQRPTAQIERLAALVTGRGACHHPDGTARLADSALRMFAPEVARHQAGRCGVQ